jgi:hypothetical protein
MAQALIQVKKGKAKKKCSVRHSKDGSTSLTSSSVILPSASLSTLHLTSLGISSSLKSIQGEGLFH